MYQDQLGEHLALKAIVDELQRESSHRPIRLLHPERDIAAVDRTLLDRPPPISVGPPRQQRSYEFVSKM
jgi:hypothetical protein